MTQLWVIRLSLICHPIAHLPMCTPILTQSNPCKMRHNIANMVQGSYRLVLGTSCQAVLPNDSVEDMADMSDSYTALKVSPLFSLSNFSK